MSGVALNVGSLSRYRGRINSMSRAVKQVLPDLATEWPFALWAQTGGRIDATWDTRPLTAAQTRVVNGVTVYSPDNLLLNSRLAAAVAGTPGTAPTSWGLGFSTGAITAVSADGLTFSATAQRIVLTQSVTVSAGSVYSVTCVVRSNSGLEFSRLLLINQVITGATSTRFANGASVASTYVPQPGDRIEERLTTTTNGGSMQVRVGVGCDTADTGTAKLDLIRVQDGAVSSSADDLTTVTTTAARFLPFPGTLAPSGYLPGPWANLTRTGLATVTLPNGLVGYGPHNLLLRSDDFGNAAWSKDRGGWWNAATVTADFGADRTGLPRADRVTAPASGSHGVLQQISATPNTAYTFSAWVKDIDYGSGLKVLSTTALGGGAPVAVVASITFGADWTFVTGTATTGPSDTSIALGIGQDATNSSKSFLVVDAQINLGGLTDYVPTTTAARYLPRITYNPSTLASQGLLVEGAATNLVGANSAFENAYWSKIGLSPSPATVGDTLTVDISNGLHIAYRSVNVTSGTAYTFSCRVRRGVGSAIATLRFDYDGNGRRFAVNPDTGSVQSAAAAFTYSVSPLDGEGFRTLTITATATTTAAVLVGFELANAGGSFWIGDGTTSLVVRNPQFETGTVATSYIPNAGTGSAVRAVDDWFLSGDALDAALGASRNSFSLFIEWFQPSTITANARLLYLGKDDTSQRIDIYCPTASEIYGYIDEDATPGNLSATAALVAGAVNKAMIVVDGAQVRVVANGGSAITRSSAFGGAMADKLRLLHGPSAVGTSHLNSYVKTARAYPGVALTIAQMQALTA